MASSIPGPSSLSATNLSQPSKVALISFPTASYTQACVLAAAEELLAPRGWNVRLLPSHLSSSSQDAAAVQQWLAEDSLTATQVLYLMDYDLIPFDEVHPAAGKAVAERCSLSSYPIRKALIRKHYLSSSVHAHAVKTRDERPVQGSETSRRAARRDPLDYLPPTWSVELQFADDLDELLIDELYDLKEQLDAQDMASASTSDHPTSPTRRKWWILKAAMADGGNGIRMFDSLDGLRSILDEFEGDSTDEEEDEDDDDDEQSSQRMSERNVQADDDEQEEGANGSGVLLGQLRHFVIQEYLQPPLLLAPPPSKPADPGQQATPSFRKFHLRAYVVCIGGLSVYLYDEMLALFAPADYQAPGEHTAGSSDEDEEAITRPDPLIHLTNTCLHADGSKTKDGRISQDNVHLLSDLCSSTNGKTPYTFTAPQTSTSSAEYETLSVADLSRLRSMAAETIGNIFSSAAKGSGSTNWLLWPHCWEVFGVDLMVVANDQGEAQRQSSEASDAWRMYLLEVNAQPDFAQSGERLQNVIIELFRRSLELAVVDGEKEAGAAGQMNGADEPWKVGESRTGMTLCFDEPMRGNW